MSFLEKIKEFWWANLDQNPKMLSRMFGGMVIAILLLLAQVLYAGVTSNIWGWSTFLGNLIWTLYGFGSAFIAVMTGADLTAYREKFGTEETSTIP